MLMMRSGRVGLDGGGGGGQAPGGPRKSSALLRTFQRKDRLNIYTQKNGKENKSANMP